MGISCFIVCCNEEAHIKRCLESICWCDEIILIDSGSTDRTLDIAKGYTSKIVTRPWQGYVLQKQAGLNLCTHEWVLNIDADEEVSPELRKEIEAVVKNNQAQTINGYYISRVVYYLGRWWRNGGWYPEFRLRLVRRSKTSWGGRDPHEKALVTGDTAYLNGELYHYTYRDISDQVNRLNTHAKSAAQSMYQEGRTTPACGILAKPLTRFVKHFIIKRGYRDGLPGFLVAVLESYYAFLKYAMLWELHQTHLRKDNESTEP